MESTDCKQCPLRQCGSFIPNSDHEIDFVRSIKRADKHFDTGATIVRERSTSSPFYSVLEGWAFRYRTLSDGRRQILNFLFPGDLIGLQEQLGAESPHGVEALTPMRLCQFKKEDLWQIYREMPSVAYDITWFAAHEEMIVDENLLSVGQRTARERIALLLVSIFRRMQQLNAVSQDNSCPFHINQQHIADAMGLSLVHTNKTLRVLVREGLCKIHDHRLQILDVGALAVTADYSALPARHRPLL